jgi:phosphatidylserine/phosphatidylglycerophosphate/cardiolipin synthase-like enzyme
VLEERGTDIVRAIGSTPDDPYSLMCLTLISAIANAEREVHLTNAYFVPDPQLFGHDRAQRLGTAPAPVPVEGVGGARLGAVAVTADAR